MSDPGLATTLADAGAELVEQGPDVEIANLANVRGDAPMAIVLLGRWGGGRSPVLVRAVRRAARSAGVRAQIVRARSALRRLGYPSVASIPWDLLHTLRLPGFDGAARRRPVEYLPQCAVVVGRRGRPEASVLDAALAAAGAQVGSAVTPRAPSVRTGLVSALTNAGLLRVAVGPARVQIENQLDALRLLRAVEVPPPVADRIPWPVASGRAGLGEWSLERRLPGERPGRTLAGPLEDDCVEFLLALHACAPGPSAAFARERAEVVAEAAGEHGDAVREVARRLDDALRPLPAGFGHGDFFLGNLLVSDGRLKGVVDWDAAGPSRLPLLDLMHLRHLAAHPSGDEDWGPTLVRFLLPWARAGADDVARGYCRRVGFEPEPSTLEALALAYWLDRTAYQLRTHPHRRRQERWLERNVATVVQAVSR